MIRFFRVIRLFAFSCSMLTAYCASSEAGLINIKPSPSGSQTNPRIVYVGDSATIGWQHSTSADVILSKAPPSSRQDPPQVPVGADTPRVEQRLKGNQNEITKAFVINGLQLSEKKVTGSGPLAFEQIETSTKAVQSKVQTWTDYLLTVTTSYVATKTETQTSDQIRVRVMDQLKAGDFRGGTRSSYLGGSSGGLGVAVVDPPQTFGWEFEAKSVLDVAALGIWDEGSDGLSEPHKVGIWDRDGNLLLAGKSGRTAP